MFEREEMTDQTIPADKVRELAEAYKLARDGNVKHSKSWLFNHMVVGNLEALLPPKPLPTLADMTPEERQECVGMWCEFEFGALAILKTVGTELAYCIVTVEINSGQSMRLERLTPRFDLPRAWNPDGTPAQEPETPRKELGVAPSTLDD